MKSLQTTFRKVLMGTRTKQFVTGIAAALMLPIALNGQITSYKANTVPVTGTGNCAFGDGVLIFNSTGTNNTGSGINALRNNTGGIWNVAMGSNALFTNTGGGYNVAIGLDALFYNVQGSRNVATGIFALENNVSGSDNTATGASALFYNTANGNTANGGNALYNNTSGIQNVANGFETLKLNVSGNYNTASGYQALYSNTASANTANGATALYTNTIGTDNVANGYGALYSNTEGNSNVANGRTALSFNTTGSGNTGIGYVTLSSNITGNNNTALGNAANVGSGALSNATAIGNTASVNASNKVRIGNTTVSVIEGQVAYTWPSDGRFKENITEEVKGLEFIKLLRPVVYNFNTRKFEEFLTKNMSADMRQKHFEGVDFAPSTAVRQSGFIAQEVEQAAKKSGYNFNAIHAPVNDNDNYGLAYDEFVVPLVKGMQEQQKMIEDQKQIIEKLQQQMNDLQKSLSSTTGIDQLNSTRDASMEQNEPNPFSHETVIKFNLPEQVSTAYMTVYDLSGKQIKTIPINQRGSASITVTSEQLAAGMYIYSIVADGKLVNSKRMIVADK